MSLIEGWLDPETAGYRDGDVVDVPHGAGRLWGTWPKVAGCEHC